MNDEKVIQALRETFTKVIDTFGERLTEEMKDLDISVLRGRRHTRCTVLVDDENERYLPVTFIMFAGSAFIDKDTFRELERQVEHDGMDVRVVRDEER